MNRIYLSPPHVSELERRLLLEAFDSNWIAPLGPHVDAFEEEFARAVHVPYAAALSSGTAALHLGLMLLGVGRDDEVLTSSLTFAATVNPIVYRGATPVFIDSDRETWTMDPGILEEELAACAARGRLPKAVVVVDLYGQCADYDRILRACEAYGVPVLEDAAEALGSTYRDVPAGNFGAVAAFSFNGNKIITTGGGGMLVSRRSDWVERARFLSTQARDQAPHYQHSEIGYNYRISNLLAAVGRGQLRMLAERVERRRAHNAGYRQLLAGVPGIAFMPEASYGRSNHWLTTVLIDPAEFGASREHVRARLDARGIETRPVWKPMHLQPAFRHHRSCGGAVSADLFERGLCLPSGSSMTAASRERVVDELLAAANRKVAVQARVPIAPAPKTEPWTEPSAAEPTPSTPPVARFVPLKRWILQHGRLISIVVQIAMVGMSNALAFWLRFDGPVPEWAQHAFWRMLPVLLVIRAAMFVRFRLFAGVWKYASVYDLHTIVSAVLAGTALFVLAMLTPLGVSGYPRSVYFVDSLLLICGLIGLRLTRRVYSEMKQPAITRRVLVIGAGSAGELVVRDMIRNRDLGMIPVGFVDDDVAKHGRQIHGTSVLGGRMELPAIMAKHHPDEILVALPSGAAATLRSILRDLEPYDVPVRTLPSLRDLMSRGAVVGQIRDLRMEDLLQRSPVTLDLRSIRRAIEGKTVMVTGASDAVATELCAEIAACRPAKIVLMDWSASALQPVLPKLDLNRMESAIVIGDGADPDFIKGVFADHRPAVVFHAASQFNPRLMETHPAEAVRRNIAGLRLVADAAVASGTERFLLLSTLKAVNARSVAGMTARIGEILVRAIGAESQTRFTVVRLGSVLGRPGTVVPIMREQIRRGTPLTVADPEVRRYFMTVSEASHLALQALAEDADAIYVLDMGEQVKLVDLARDLAKLEGGKSEDETIIRFTGLRHHDRLFDELATAEETVKHLGASGILKVQSPAPAPSDVFLLCDSIIRALDEGSDDRIRETLNTAGAVLRDEAPPSGSARRPAAADDAGGDPLDTDVSIMTLTCACPACLRGRAHRSRARSVAERIKKQFTPERIYRCQDCGWRGWMLPIECAQGLALPDDRLLGLDLDLSSIDSSVAEPSGPPARLRADEPPDAE